MSVDWIEFPSKEARSYVQATTTALLVPGFNWVFLNTVFEERLIQHKSTRYHCGNISLARKDTNADFYSVLESGKQFFSWIPLRIPSSLDKTSFIKYFADNLKYSFYINLKFHWPRQSLGLNSESEL